jgi:hypothetical protein
MFKTIKTRLFLSYQRKQFNKIIFQIYRKFFKLITSKIGIGELLLLIIGCVVLVWLHGGILFFWDTILPFHPESDIYYYSFTWDQGFNNGAPLPPNEFASYFFIFYIFHNIFNLNFFLSQFVLIYILFTLSGITMYHLIKFLFNENYNAKFSMPAFAGSLVYMFNFYVAYYLLMDFFESWFLYSFLPLIIIIFLSGAKKSLIKKSYISNIFYLVLLFQLISVSFWEAPYLVWMLVIIMVFILNFFINNKEKIVGKNSLSLIKYFIITVVVIFFSSLWWIYTYIGFLYLDFSYVSMNGLASTSYYILLNNFLYSGNNPYLRALNIIALYPQIVSAPNNMYIWQNVYVLSVHNFIFIFSAFIFLVTIFLPMFQVGKSKNKIMNNKLLYITILLILFIGLQGINPINQWLVELLIRFKFNYIISALYGTNIQFLGFPLIFFYAIATSKTITIIKDYSLVESKKNFLLNIKSKRKLMPILYNKNFHINNIRNKKDIVILVILLIVVVIYPWYMWTPYATQVFVTGNKNQQIPSVVSLPPYFYNAFNYINKNANNSITLILPESNNFLTMNFNGSTFADDEPPTLISGSPVIYQNSVITNNIESLIYNPVLIGNKLANYLSSINVKFILLNTIDTGASNHPYYNISYLKYFLQHEPNIKLIKMFGPLELYENMLSTKIIQIGNSISFNSTILHPYGTLNLINNLSKDKFANDIPFLNASYQFINNTLIFKYNKYVSPYNPLVFFNTIPLNINISIYHYLLITIKTTNTWFYIQTDTGYNNNAYGVTMLQPFNFTSNSLSNSPYINSSCHFEKIIYPLYNQIVMPYSTIIRVNDSEYLLNKLEFGLSIQNKNKSGIVEITNISLAQYVSNNDNYVFLARNVNTTNEVLINSNISTNNSNIDNISINSREINPTHYIVKINNANGSFILYFKQSYNPGWILYENGNRINSTLYIGDVYNCAWLITKKGNFTLEIVYSQQQIYNIPSVVSLPPYFYNAFNYINKNANNSITLILPESNNFLTMNFNGSTFADDEPPTLISGSPVIYQNSVITNNIESLIYNPVLIGNKLANYLSSINVKFILLNTIDTGASNHPYYNISYLKYFLQHEPNIKLIKMFGPLELYENMLSTKIIQIGNSISFNSTILHPYGTLNLINNLSKDKFANDIPFLNASYQFINNTLIFKYNKYVSPYNPLVFFNTIPLNINISIYHYLLITIKTTNTWFYIQTDTGYNNNAYGVTMLQPFNFTSNSLSNSPYINSSCHFEKIIYPLYNQIVMPYSTIIRVNDSEYLLNKLEFGLSIQNKNKSGIVEITNISLAQYVSNNDNYVFLARNVNTTNEVLINSNISTNNSNIDNISINSREINPTHYIVKINNANGSFILYFKQSYNPGWILYENGNRINSTLYIGDVYNCAWLITKKGNFTLEIVYSQQQIYNLIVKISIVSLSAILFTTIINVYCNVYVCTKRFKNDNKNQ